MSGALLWVLGGVFLLLVAALVVILVSRGSGRSTVASTSVRQAVPFSFSVGAVPDGPAELWLRYSVSFPYERPFGGQVSKVFCLVLELDIDGQPMTFGHGGRAPEGLLEFEGLVHYNTRFTPGTQTTATRYDAKVLVKRFPSCPRSVRGTLRGCNGTSIEEGQLTLRS